MAVSLSRIASALAAALLIALTAATAPAAMPDPASSAYYQEDAILRPDPIDHNYVNRRTWIVRARARDLVIAPGGTGTLFDRTHNNPAIEKLEIFADRLIVRTVWRLPGTHVVIHAREIVFVDAPDGSWRSAIITTPVTAPEPPAGLYGEDGLIAGNVELMIDTWVSPSVTWNTWWRIRVRGGDGGPGHMGKDGVDGKNMPYWDGSPKFAGVGEPPTGTVYIYSNFSGTTSTLYGKDEWPTDGTDAVAATWPGKGGDGGVITANRYIDFPVDFSGGGPGLGGPAHRGGTHGRPQDSVHVEYRRSPITQNYEFVTRGTRVTKGGIGTLATGAGVGGGEAGDHLFDGSLPWFHPFMLSPLKAWAADAIAAGQGVEARERLIEGFTLARAFRQTPQWLAMPESWRTEALALENQVWDLYIDAGNAAGESWALYE